jgi:hypothetical protein
MAADRGGALYVADSDGERILAFDFGGQYRVRWVASGPAPDRSADWPASPRRHAASW